MAREFEPLSSGEVLSLNVYKGYDANIVYEEGMFKMPHTFRRSELEQNIKDVLIGFHGNYERVRTKLLHEGLPCEAWRFGSQDWQKGKVRVRVEIEFCPDEPESLISNSEENFHAPSSDSPLDDIRQQILEEGG